MKSISETYILFLITVAFTGLLILTTCSEDSSTSSLEEDEIEVTKVVIEPASASFEIDEKQEFSAFLISASGDTVNKEFDIEWNWYSSNPEVFTVENNGTAYGKRAGEAYCVVEVTAEPGKVAAKLRFTGRDSAFVSIF